MIQSESSEKKQEARAQKKKGVKRGRNHSLSLNFSYPTHLLKSLLYLFMFMFIHKNSI
jgi:hypothetical protein